jgi:hypothetical protein
MLQFLGILILIGLLLYVIFGYDTLKKVFIDYPTYFNEFIMWFKNFWKKEYKKDLEIYLNLIKRKDKYKPTGGFATANREQSASKVQDIFEQVFYSKYKNAQNKVKSKNGEKITDWERNYLWEGINKRKRVPCIHCENEDMYQGPSGGMSANWRCPACGQGINLTLVGNKKEDFWCDNIGIDINWINVNAQTRKQ